MSKLGFGKAQQVAHIPMRFENQAANQPKIHESTSFYDAPKITSL